MKQNLNKKGFTLLEILLVIAAIGILASIVLVAINPTRQINQARQATINNDKNTIEKALQQRLIDTGSYPSSVIETQREICKTGNEQIGGSTACSVKADLRELVPDYVAAIPSSTTYTVARGNDGRIYVNNTETVANFNCPTGYIKVPGNSLYKTKDFCVMKYEAKAGSATVAATTQAIGLPQINISQSNSITSCSLNGAGYGLMSNAEWMTIARNIEAQASNWTGGAVGSGVLWRGHTDNNPSSALAASTDNDPYSGTNDSSPSIERRTYTLSNGEVIWDLSGNVWEWLSDTIQGQDKPNTNSGGLWQEWRDINNYGALSYDLTSPSNSEWNSSQNMGQYYAGSLTGGPFAFRRGVNWDDTSNSGIFSLRLTDSTSFTNIYYGFRCVLR
jgi:prepilin-type N-terminal cleavage/methylation domain-containing protein